MCMCIYNIYIHTRIQCIKHTYLLLKIIIIRRYIQRKDKNILVFLFYIYTLYSILKVYIKRKRIAK